MSSSYSANQYDGAFKSQRLQNWCETKRFKETPTARRGHTTFIASDKGHLLPGVVKRGSAWPDFKGTWDLPSRIPAHRINPTSRSVDGLNRLKLWGLDPEHIGKAQPHGGIKSSDKMQDCGKQSNEDVPQNCNAPFSEGEAPSLSSYSPVTVGEPTVSQKQELQAAVVESVHQRAEKTKQVTETYEPLSQRIPAEQKPAPGEETKSTYCTGKGSQLSSIGGTAANHRMTSTSKHKQRDAK